MRDLLKIMTCGSVDDGKSTLIGHIMYDANAIYTDQISELKAYADMDGDNRLDYSLLLDGLEAEREQRITIDVAYRFFSTENRSFIIADTPGHKEYTRNMAVGASFADLAVILIDASKGILTQTARHFRICRLMGINDYVFVVNKMDIVGYDEKVFLNIKKDLEEMTGTQPLASCYIIPVSATEGDNLTVTSKNMQWFSGISLFDYLETVEVRQNDETGFILPVQRISRVSGKARGYQGCVESGKISVGDRITVMPSGESSNVAALLVSGEKSDTAERGRQITMSLTDEIDISRGCVICAAASPSVTTCWKATVLWLDDEPLSIGKSYFVKLGSAEVPASIISVDHAIDVNKNTEYHTDTICKNDIFTCTISASSAIVVDSFSSHRSLGEFILIDRVTHATSACGTVIEPLSNNFICPVASDITRKDRAALKGQNPITLWFTGLPASGKTSVANLIEKRLYTMGKHTMLLDGDAVRSGINRGLGFSKEDRAENIRVTAEIAKLMNDAGLIVLVSLVSPAAKDRETAREIIGNAFTEIFMSVSPDTCEKRDKKEYYKKARQGIIKNFTGVSGEYEIPEHPDLIVDSENLTVKQCADAVMSFLQKKYDIK